MRRLAAAGPTVTSAEARAVALEAAVDERDPVASMRGVAAIGLVKQRPDDTALMVPSKRRIDAGAPEPAPQLASRRSGGGGGDDVDLT